MRGGRNVPWNFPLCRRFYKDTMGSCLDTASRRTRFDVIAGSLRSSRFGGSAIPLVVVCLCLVGIVGYIDYLTGYERPLLLFYLLPISLAAWFGGFLTGLGIAVVSVAVSMLSDVAAGIPALGYWNAGMALVSYALFAGILSKLQTLVSELDRRVKERTADLQREVTAR